MLLYVLHACYMYISKMVIIFVCDILNKVVIYNNVVNCDINNYDMTILIE